MMRVVLMMKSGVALYLRRKLRVLNAPITASVYRLENLMLLRLRKEDIQPLERVGKLRKAEPTGLIGIKRFKCCASVAQLASKSSAVVSHGFL